MARSTHRKSQPVTPQRLSQQRPGHRYSSSQSFYKSPPTPASPYTPLSLRSFTSSASSTLTTPDNDKGRGVRGFSPNVVSPIPGIDGRDHSLADIAKSWRSRASENGIKVSSMADDSHFGDDEASDRTVSEVGNDSGFISTEEALLAPSLISNRQAFTPFNRPRAQSHVPSPTTRSFISPSSTRATVRHLTQPTSPLASRRLNQNSNVTSTPPPNRALARQLKLKGSFTDPAITRRREAFAPVWTPAQHNTNNMNQTFSLGFNQDTSLDLFDIDENDLENDFDYTHDKELADNSLMEQHFHPSKNSFDNNTDALGCPGYTLPLLPSYGQAQQQFFSNSQAPFSDPFHGNALGSITESVEHFFHTQQQQQRINNPIVYSRHGQRELLPQLAQPWGSASTLAVPAHGISPRDAYSGGPAWVPIPSPLNIIPIATKAEPKQISSSSASGCSVCLASSPRTLAILAPCGHPLCSGCLTSALNIVGEKDMECAVCRGKVADFKLVSTQDTATTLASTYVSHSGKKTPEQNAGKSFFDTLFSSPESGGPGGIHALESAFEFGLGLENARASTPKHDDSRKRVDAKQSISRERVERVKDKGDENIVLRIDNVPWDITPPQIQQWLQQPLSHVHVLLDKRGKTMSHAYVEVADVAVAGRILRGEAQGELPNGKPRERGSVLGKGRRARGVTITRSGQEELMTDLFPSWRGSFDGSRPSLAGLDNDQVISALEGGLIGENEVTGLLHLIKEPDSHFLKAPSLPFHSLISILSKFPSDVDSRVFWASSVRDTLYDITYAAVQMLLSRVNSKSSDDLAYSMDLVSDLVKAAMNCHAFTAQQLNKFTEFLEPHPATACSSQTAPELLYDLIPPTTPENSGPYSCVPDVPNLNIEEDMHPPFTPQLSSESEDREPLTELAREFGVEAQLVKALAQRLAVL